MAYETMCEVLAMIDFKKTEDLYEEGRTAYEGYKDNLVKENKED